MKFNRGNNKSCFLFTKLMCIAIITSEREDSLQFASRFSIAYQGWCKALFGVILVKGNVLNDLDWNYITVRTPFHSEKCITKNTGRFKWHTGYRRPRFLRKAVFGIAFNRDF